jgi:hypothetical protein
MEVVVIARGAGVTGATTIGIETVVVADCTEELESITFTTKPKLPADVGVPEIAPDAADRLRPGGSWPEETLQVYGAVPPLMVRVPLYEAPTTP